MTKEILHHIQIRRRTIMGESGSEVLSEGKNNIQSQLRYNFENYLSKYKTFEHTWFCLLAVCYFLKKTKIISILFFLTLLKILTDSIECHYQSVNKLKDSQLYIAFWDWIYICRRKLIMWVDITTILIWRLLQFSRQKMNKFELQIKIGSKTVSGNDFQVRRQFLHSVATQVGKINLKLARVCMYQVWIFI